MTNIAGKLGEADSPSPRPRRVKGNVKATSTGRSRWQGLWPFGDGMTFCFGSSIRRQYPQREESCTVPLSASLISHFQVKTVSWHEDVAPWSNVFFEARDMPVVFGSSRIQSAGHMSHTKLIPGINLFSSIFTDINAMVHATLGIRPPATKDLTGTDFQGRMDQRTKATIAVRG